MRLRFLRFLIALICSSIVVVFARLHSNDVAQIENNLIESEALVVGATVRSIYNSPDTKFPNLGFIDYQTFSYDSEMINNSSYWTQDLPLLVFNLENAPSIKSDDQDENFQIYFPCNDKNSLNIFRYKGRHGYLYSGSEKREVRLKSVLRNVNDKETCRLTFVGSLMAIEKPIRIELKGKVDDPSSLIFSPYLSSYGLQGKLVSMVTQITTNIGVVKTLFVFILVLLGSLIFEKLYSESNKNLAFSFLISIIFSPWVIAFSGNLFWALFIWLLAILFAIYFSFEQKSKYKILWGFLFFFSIFMKCLMGYEFLSTLLLCASAFSWIAFEASRKSRLLNFFIINSLGVIGFLSALVLHAKYRSGNIIDGIIDIWQKDVSRRTFGDPSLFDPVFNKSLSAGVWETLGLYLFNWKTNFLFGISSNFLAIVFLFSFMYMVLKEDLRRMFLQKFFFSFITFFSATASWLILAKSHSYIHTHLNFIAWYLGGSIGILSLIFLSLSGFIGDSKNFIIGWRRE